MSDLSEFDAAIAEAAEALVAEWTAGAGAVSWSERPTHSALIAAVEAKREEQRPKCTYFLQGEFQRMRSECGEPAVQELGGAYGDGRLRCIRHKVTVTDL
jgi:hypothetical protein